MKKLASCDHDECAPTHCRKPIFVEYYSHLSSDCYKIRNPWTKYKEEVIVLCPVSAGLELAIKIARTIIQDLLVQALNSKED